MLEQEFPPESLEAKVVEAIKTCYDPEIPVNIYELGLIYAVQVTPKEEEEGAAAHVTMTLTSPACPVAGSLPPEVEEKIRSVPGVTEATVEVVWEPPWSLAMMSEGAKLQLGIF
jgi:FeS assembly SUF system protein